MKKSRRSKRSTFYRVVLFLFVFAQFVGVFLVKAPAIETANLTSASATLGNSRLSYRAGVSSGSSGASVVTIDSSSNADNDTNHLFPKDSVCFINSAFSGCNTNAAYTVENIVDTTHFNFTPALSGALLSDDYVVASQSGSLTISFVTTSQVPSNGDILVTIPSVDITSRTNDSIPDTNSSIATNGFDLNGIAAADISTTGCTDGNWGTTETITAGDASNDSTIRIDRSTSACSAGSTITVTIDSSPGLMNPAPITSGHTQGTADVYTINLKTRDGSDNTIDSINVKVAPIEAVLVSATVQESLSFSIAGVASSQSKCGATTSVTTTATSVPWGTISSSNTFLNAAHLLTVSTNSAGGYAVKSEENDQMGKDGVACSGATAGESANCIKDTTADDGSATSATSADWATATNNGFGFALANSSGTDANFLYNESSRTFSTRQFADQEASETKGTIMSNSGAVSGKAVNVCYRISTSGTQPAGYYYNKVKYTATPVF